MSASVDNLAERDGVEPAPGLGGALRQLRDPILLAAVPVTFALLLAFVGYGNSWPIGFDFRGTLWEPARALLDGTPIYPVPEREAVAVGNPAVYPPVFILASVPLALLPAAAASWLWLFVLAAGVLASMWILGVRDWRCLVLAVTSPVVVHGLFYGNLTVLLVLPLALAWRYRDRARGAGLAVGVALAAKLFVWPLVVWLLLTRRFRAAAWAVGSAAVLVLGAWALIGFEGFRDYPKLLRVLQDVYAVRSVSLSTVAGALGAPVSAAVAVAAVAGLVCLGVAAWLVRRARRRPARLRRRRRAACVLASPIVWPNYAALLLVPIAITWPRLGAGVVLRVRRVARESDHSPPHGAGRRSTAPGRDRAGVALESFRARALVRRRDDAGGGRRRAWPWRGPGAMAREIEPGGVSPRASGGGATSAGLAEAARIAPAGRPLRAAAAPRGARCGLSDLHDRFDTFGFDFRGTLWEPAGGLLDGASPYPSATDAASIASGNPSVYPPLPITWRSRWPGSASTRR